MALNSGSLFTSTMFSSVLFPSNLFGTASGASFATQAFDFTSALPSGWAATRSGNTASRFDDTGDEVQVLANVARIDHTDAGIARGVLFENAVAVNKVTMNTAVLDASSGFTVISGTGTCTVVSTAEGDFYEFTQTSGSYTIQISTTVGNTNKHSMSYEAYSLVGTTSVDLVGVGSQSIPVGTSPIKYVFEDLTPTATTRYMRLTITGGRSLRIRRMHLEEAQIISRLIYNTAAGSTATRNIDQVKYSNLDTSDFFDQSSGAIVALVRPNRIGAFEQGFFVAAEGNGASNTIGVRSITGDGFLEANFIVASTDAMTEKVGKPLEDGQLYACGLIWNANHIKLIHSHGASVFTKDGPITMHSATLNNMWIGRIREFWGYMNGHVDSLYVLKGSVGVKDCVDLWRSQIGKVVLAIGQSNIAYETKSQIISTYDNSGEVAAIAELNNYYAGRNAVCNAAVGGSRGQKGATPDDNYWFENDWSNGPLMIKALEMAAAIGPEKTLGIRINNGESDQGLTAAEYKQYQELLISGLRAVVGNVPVIIEPHGRRSDNASADAFYELRQAVKEEVVAEGTNVYMGPNAKVLAMYDETGATDTVHLAYASYATKARWGMRKLASIDGQSVTGPVDGSVISNVSRSGTTVTVTLTHPSGITDFTPTTGIEGFVFEDDGTPITITAAVRTNATTITLTLNSAPTGTEVLMYCYGTGYGLNPANLVKGNDANTMPLQQFKGVL
jgi:hypothetical protein